MTVKSILKLATSLLNRKDFLSYLESGSSLDVNIKDEIDTLVACYNVVAEELSTVYDKIVYTQKLTVSNGVLKYTQFTYNPVKILSVKDNDGKDVDCEILPTELRTNVSRIVVEYTYIPKKRLLDDESDFKNTPFKERVFAYGIATEYLLIKGSYEEASLWHDKYLGAIKNSLSIKGSSKIKGRVWW
jgi:hypothetical protein